MLVILLLVCCYRRQPQRELEGTKRLSSHKNDYQSQPPRAISLQPRSPTIRSDARMSADAANLADGAVYASVDDEYGDILPTTAPSVQADDEYIQPQPSMTLERHNQDKQADATQGMPNYYGTLT